MEKKSLVSVLLEYLIKAVFVVSLIVITSVLVYIGNLNIKGVESIIPFLVFFFTLLTTYIILSELEVIPFLLGTILTSLTLFIIYHVPFFAYLSLFTFPLLVLAIISAYSEEIDELKEETESEEKENEESEEETKEESESKEESNDETKDETKEEEFIVITKDGRVLLTKHPEDYDALKVIKV